MKVCGQQMEITLTVCGRERKISEQELIAILEKHFSNEAIEQAQGTESRLSKVYEVAQTPTEGKSFEVDFEKINQKLFEKKRKDQRQEWTRQRILEAFKEVKMNPEKYAEPFETYMPKKDWSVKTGYELEKEATRFGDHNGDWVEQALEWAQRISNGESWEDVCNKPDKANWYRWVIGPNGKRWLVGGSVRSSDVHPASYVISNYYPSGRLFFTVPFVVLKKKVALSTVCPK